MIWNQVYGDVLQIQFQSSGNLHVVYSKFLASTSIYSIKTLWISGQINAPNKIYENFYEAKEKWYLDKQIISILAPRQYHHILFLYCRSCHKKPSLLVNIFRAFNTFNLFCQKKCYSSFKIIQIFVPIANFCFIWLKMWMEEDIHEIILCYLYSRL